ncbi:MAG: hypothetical protein WA908_01645 [Pontixanthobacter sp.]
MVCQTVSLGNGTNAIVCDRSKPKRCGCGRGADRLCDWKVPDRTSGTCDEPICSHCTTTPAPDKDLCMTHASDWNAWRLKKGTAA